MLNMINNQIKFINKDVNKNNPKLVTASLRIYSNLFLNTFKPVILVVDETRFLFEC